MVGALGSRERASSTAAPALREPHLLSEWHSEWGFVSAAVYLRWRASSAAKPTAAAATVAVVVHELLGGLSEESDAV